MVGVRRCFPWSTPSFVNTLMQWILYVKAVANFLLRLSVRHVDRMNTQIWLLNSLVRLAGWVNSEFVGSMRDQRNTERMMINSLQNVEMHSKMSYLLFFFPPCQNRRIPECLFLARIAKIILGNYSSSLLAEVSRNETNWNERRETSAGFRRVVWWSRRPNFWSKLTGFQNRFRLMCNARALLDVRWQLQSPR